MKQSEVGNSYPGIYDINTESDYNPSAPVTLVPTTVNIEVERLSINFINSKGLRRSAILLLAIDYETNVILAHKLTERFPRQSEFASFMMCIHEELDAKGQQFRGVFYVDDDINNISNAIVLFISNRISMGYAGPEFKNSYKNVYGKNIKTIIEKCCGSTVINRGDLEIMIRLEINNFNNSIKSQRNGN